MDFLVNFFDHYFSLAENESVLISLGLTSPAAADAGIHKRILGSRTI